MWKDDGQIDVPRRFGKGVGVFYLVGWTEVRVGDFTITPSLLSGVGQPRTNGKSRSSRPFTAHT